MRFYWASWYTADADITNDDTPFQWYITGEGMEEPTQYSICALLEADSEAEVWAGVARYFPDYRVRFCELRDAHWQPNDRFPGFERRTALKPAPRDGEEVRMSKPTVRSLHDKAMDLATTGFVQRHEGRDDEYKRLCGEAFEFERQAADLVPFDSVGFTRGILYRSAAWLAHNAGRYQEAFDAAQEGLRAPVAAWLQAELAEVSNAAWSALAAKPAPHDGEGA